MNQSDKELLLKDLSARIGFGTIVNEPVQGDFELIGVVRDRIITTCEEEGKVNDFPVELVRPYLRPLSSMTEEEYQEFLDADLLWLPRSDDDCVLFINEMKLPKCMDLLLKGDFDYNDLIPKGLANEKK